MRCMGINSFFADPFISYGSTFYQKYDRSYLNSTHNVQPHIALHPVVAWDGWDAISMQIDKIIA